MLSHFILPEMLFSSPFLWRTVAVEMLNSTASAIDHNWWPSEDLNLDSLKFSKNSAVTASISGSWPGVDVSSDASEQRWGGRQSLEVWGSDFSSTSMGYLKTGRHPSEVDKKGCQERSGWLCWVLAVPFVNLLTPPGVPATLLVPLFLEHAKPISLRAFAQANVSCLACFSSLSSYSGLLLASPDLPKHQDLRKDIPGHLF